MLCLMEDSIEPQEPQENSLDFIQAEVQKWHETFRQEFEAIQASDVHVIKEKVKEKFANSLLNFVDTIIELSTEAEGEGVRLSAAKFGLNFVLGDVHEDPKEDPLNVLLKSLTKVEKRKRGRPRKTAEEVEDYE